MNYYRDELYKVAPFGRMAIQLRDGENNKTNWLDLNEESTPVIVAFLKLHKENYTDTLEERI